MHFLLTNDDGIEAGGLGALEAAVRSLPGVEVTVVAPLVEQSQCGHRVTTTQRLRVERRGEGRYAVAGTPADCVRVALFGLGLKVDGVLSGINHGGNMGQDLEISGTVAAVREAAYHGLRGMAFSHYLVRGLALDWVRVEGWTRRLLLEVGLEDLAAGEWWTVNFPHLDCGQSEMPEVLKTVPARSALPVSFREEESAEAGVRWLQYDAAYSGRGQDAGSDVAACFGGRISLCRCGL